MIKRIVRLSFKPDHRQSFLTVFTKHRIKMLENGICEELSIYVDKNDPNTFFTISLWTSEQALEDYRKSTYFEEIWGKVKPWFNEKAKAWSLEQVD